MDFWENILRLPRFFFTSVLGLVFIIINPILKELKNNKFLIVLIFFMLLLLVFILFNMLNFTE